MSAVRNVVVAGVQLLVELRPVGGLGWTWSYQSADGVLVVNSGSLEASEKAALEAATRAASIALRGAPPQA